jgi:hypothetical protein
MPTQDARTKQNSLRMNDVSSSSILNSIIWKKHVAQLFSGNDEQHWAAFLPTI